MGGGGAGMAPHGSQYFIMQDTDGYAFVVLDAVSVTEIDHLELEVMVYITQSTWEYTDSVKIWAADSAGQEVVVYSDYDMDDQVEGTWVRHTMVLHGTGWRSPTTMIGQENIGHGLVLRGGGGDAGQLQVEWVLCGSVPESGTAGAGDPGTVYRKHGSDRATPACWVHRPDGAQLPPLGQY